MSLSELGLPLLNRPRAKRPCSVTRRCTELLRKREDTKREGSARKKCEQEEEEEDRRRPASYPRRRQQRRHFSIRLFDWNSLSRVFGVVVGGRVASHRSFPQDGAEEDLDRAHQRRAQSPGDLHQEEVWPDEEGLRAQRPLRLRDLGHHLQLAQQAVPVCLHGHGQSPPQVHR